MQLPPPSQNDEQALLDYVTDRDVPCPRCAYNIRGLTQPRCPECGNLLQLTVGSLSPLNRAWLTMLAALLLPAGIGVLGCVGLAVALQHLTLSDLFNPRDAEATFAMLMVMYTILCIPLSIAAITLRRAFSRLPTGAQTTLATLPAIADGVGFLFFLSLIS